MRSRPREPARHSPLLTQATTVPASQRKEEQELGWRAGRGGVTLTHGTARAAGHQQPKGNTDKLSYSRWNKEENAKQRT